jgi:hypothetical protein
VLVGCLLAGCGAGTELPSKPTPGSSTQDGGVDDAGAPLPLPQSFTFSTERGTFTGAQAFSVYSAESQLEFSDGGGATYVGFQATDTGQCPRANGPSDGGYAPPLEVTHLARGFVRTLDGSPVQPGTYTIGMSNGDHVQTYFELVEYFRDGGDSSSYLATTGTLAIDARDGGHLEGHLEVALGDPATQQDLPFSGGFVADSCTGQ